MDITSLRTGLTLEPGTALTLPRHAHGALLVVLRGRVWLTESGGLDDHFIEAGQKHPVQGRGPVVIECDSDEPAQWRLEPPTKAGRSRVVAIALPGLELDERAPLVQRQQDPHEGQRQQHGAQGQEQVQYVHFHSKLQH